MAKITPRFELIVAALLIGFFWLVSVYSVTEKSATQDEGLHLISGLSYWLFDDYRLQPENGNLPQRLGSLPAYLLGAHLVPEDHSLWTNAEQFRLGTVGLYGIGNEGIWLLFLGRVVMITCSLGVLILVWRWSRSLWGPGGGLISLLVACSSTDLIANGRLVTSDVFFLGALLAYTWSFWRLIHGITLSHCLFYILSACVICVAKYSAVFIIPISILLLCTRMIAGKRDLNLSLWRGKISRKIHGRGKSLLALLAISSVAAISAWGSIWFAYGTRFEAFTRGEGTFYRDFEQILPEEGFKRTVLETFHEYKIFPEPFIYGFTHTLHYSKSRSAYFMGEHGNGGWRLFFPISFLIKSPITFLLIVGLTFYTTVLAIRTYLREDRKKIFKGIYETSPIWLALGLYGTTAVLTNLNIGHRHILPCYGFLFILCGSLALWFKHERFRQTKIIPATLTVILIAAPIEAHRIFPNYLSFFNALVGGPENGRYYLVDSSLDWGQDLPQLSAYLEKTPFEGPTYSMLFTPSDIEYYGVKTTQLFSYGGDNYTWALPELKPGRYVASATSLMGPYISVWGEWDKNKDYFFDLHERLIAEAVSKSGGPYQIAQNMIAMEAEEKVTDWHTTFYRFFHYRLHLLRLILQEQDPTAIIANTMFVYELKESNLVNARLVGTAHLPNGLTMEDLFDTYRQLKRSQKAPAQ